MISLPSASPPHKEMATWGGSGKLSTPLSAPLLPTDCGDRLELRSPISTITSASPLTEPPPPSLDRQRT